MAEGSEAPAFAAANTGSQSKAWVFTLNNFTEEEKNHLINEEDSRYMVFGNEISPSTGTPHLQGYVVFAQKWRFNRVKKFIPRAWIAIAKADADCNYKYCTKGGDFEEHGERPMSKKAQGRGEKRRWEEAWECAMNDDMEGIDADIRIRCYNTLKKIRKDASMMTKKVDSTEQMLWFWGKAGTGKSRKAREDYPDCYLKACNRWWDGYVPGSRNTVLIEDFDKRHDGLIHYLKIWSDRYDFPVEVKGCSMRIRPERIVITSNYHPSQIWTEESDLGPILRRFKCVEFKTLGVQVEGIAPVRVEPDFTPHVVVDLASDSEVLECLEEM